MEELVSREYIALEHPDAVVNVIDASALERNLFFTIQLMELRPAAACFGQPDRSCREKRDHRRYRKTRDLLGVPVIPTVAIRGKGISESHRSDPRSRSRITRFPPVLTYGREIEERIGKIVSLMGAVTTPYPVRWIAIKLLERDPEVARIVGSQDPSIVAAVAGNSPKRSRRCTGNRSAS